MYKNILVPISLDHERDANGALEIARAIGEEGAKVTLLHVIEQVQPYVASQIPEGVLMANRQRVEEELAELSKTTPGSATVVVTGHSSRTILDWASDHEVDCIIIASHRPGMQDLLLGSTAARVVRHAHCAVHVVR